MIICLWFNICYDTIRYSCIRFIIVCYLSWNATTQPIETDCIVC